MKDLAVELHRRKREHLYRSRRVVEAGQGVKLTVDGRPFLAFCSNDYLGLASHPEVVKAMQEAAAIYGVGSGAAHLVTGHSTAHHALEEELADFVGRPRALLFSTGYMANLGSVSALVGRADSVYEDRLNHASLLDAGRISGARFMRYRHRDIDDLAARLSARKVGEKLIVTDGVFSMDGDLAPVPELAALARRYDSWLMIDDAHGLGVLGADGRGVLEHFGQTLADVPVLVGTLGKAFGTAGAFVAGSEDFVETLIQDARTYVYTTAPPPAVAEATRVSLRLVRQEPWRREHLAKLVQRFRQGAEQLGLPLADSQTPIQPLMVGGSEKALELSEALRHRGILISAIRPPTVPPGSARLRITFSAAHSEQHVDQLLDTLGQVLGCAESS
jgi:8-amino-7-oxononanoate synthase